MLDTLMNDYLIFSVPLAVLFSVAFPVSVALLIQGLIALVTALRKRGAKQRYQALKLSATELLKDAQADPRPLYSLPLLYEVVRYRLRNALTALGMLQLYLTLHLWWQMFKQHWPMPWILRRIKDIHSLVNYVWASWPFQFVRSLYRTVKRFLGGIIQRGLLRLWKAFTKVVKWLRRLILLVTGVGATPFLIGLLLLVMTVVVTLSVLAYTKRLRKRAERGEKSQGFFKELTAGLKDLFQAWFTYVMEGVVNPLKTGVLGPLLRKYELQVGFANGMMTAIGTVTTLSLAGWVNKPLGIAVAILMTLILQERSLNFFKKFEERQAYKASHGGKARSAEDARKILRDHRHLVWARVMRDAELSQDEEGILVTRSVVRDRLASKLRDRRKLRDKDKRIKAWKKDNKAFFKTKRAVLRANRKARRKAREATQQLAA